MHYRENVWEFFTAKQKDGLTFLMFNILEAKIIPYDFLEMRMGEKITTVDFQRREM